ncbi:Major sperm protein (MSP) domain [Dillenia turbinata]|uniref:Major sperm protein (MSP) domain n=1 Tax=Dillenia turbinata TaxID=194707 RepID=A0AAN8UKJ8_9MAGN
MTTGNLLNIQPSELKFPFELRKQSSCSMQLTNKSDQYVAFKVKTTNPKKYCVRPNTGVVLPGATCNVTVTMQAQKETPPDMQCKDKFLLQSVIAPNGATSKDITQDMFNKEEGKVVEEFKLRVVYIPANPPSLVPEGSQEGYSPKAPSLENGNQISSMFSAVHVVFYVTKSLEETKDNLFQATRSPEAPKEKFSEGWTMISKLIEEKSAALQQNQRLHQQLDLLTKEVSRSRAGGFPPKFVVLVALLGVLIGYLIRRT